MTPKCRKKLGQRQEANHCAKGAKEAEGNLQVGVRAQELSPPSCTFRLVNCAFREILLGGSKVWEITV